MMPDPAAAHSALAALISGVVTSLHCAGMCGPLTCSLLSGGNVNSSSGDATVVGSAYHVARLSAYAALGAFVGGVGSWPLQWIAGSSLRWLPWTGVIVLVALAFNWDRRIPRLPGLGRWTWKLRFFTGAAGRSKLFRAAALGAATPLLPCGPLYVMLAFSVFAGSAVRGAELMLAFGLGTVPALWLAQAQWARLQARVTPQVWGRWRTGLALAAALVLTWRLRGTLGWGGVQMGQWVCF